MFESKYKDPLCPCCNARLEFDDTYDMEYDDESIVLYQIGHCPKCDRSYQWCSSATLVSWANTSLEEVK
jgi:transcription initiation factor IIE alpha subunit